MGLSQDNENSLHALEAFTYLFSDLKPKRIAAQNIESSKEGLHT